MTSSEPTLETTTRATLDALATLRDELRLRAHLAKLDTADAWAGQVLPRLDVVEARLKSGLEALREAGDAKVPDELRMRAHLALAEARDGWRALEPHVSPIVERLRGARVAATKAVQEGAREARREEQLWGAAAELTAAHRDDARERVRGELREAGASMEDAARLAAKEVREAVHALRTRLHAG